MNYYIEYENEKIKIKDIKSLSFKEYNILIDILKFNWINIEEQYKALLLLLTKLNIKEINKIINIKNIDFEKILTEDIKSKKFNNKFDGLKFIDLENIIIGRFIDLEYFLINTGEESIESIVALLFLPNDFEKKDFENLKEKIRNEMKIGTAIQYQYLFADFRVNFYKLYEGLFQDLNFENIDEDIEIDIDKEDEYDKLLEKEEDVEDEPKNNFGIIEFIYMLSDGDYLKVDKLLNKPLYNIMNYISWQKEYNEKLNEKYKNNKIDGKF